MEAEPTFDIRALSEADRVWADQLLISRWGSTVIVSRGVVHDAAALPALVAWRASGRFGLATYAIAGDACELVTLDATSPGSGAGAALLEAVASAARAAGCPRLWLITTNDNTAALRFYQRRGLRLVAVHPQAVMYSRTLKPEIPEVGADGIPIRDELELELRLE